MSLMWTVLLHEPTIQDLCYSRGFMIEYEVLEFNLCLKSEAWTCIIIKGIEIDEKPSQAQPQSSKAL